MYEQLSFNSTFSALIKMCHTCFNSCSWPIRNSSYIHNFEWKIINI